jgi:hypothetical protein
MPDPGTTMHVASLVYYFTFSKLTAATGPVTFEVPDPVRFTFSFETGSIPNEDGSDTITWDTSQWSASVEAELATTITAICGPVATLLGLTLAQVQAAVTVKRVWTLTPNIQGAGTSSGRTVLTDQMAYPAA